MDLKLNQRITEAVEAVRVWLPNAPQHLRAFVEECRADPMAMLRTTAARVTIIASSGLVLAIVIYSVGEWIAPSDKMGETAEIVSVRVRCMNPKCAWHKTSTQIKVDVDFDDWPTKCSQCKQKTLYPLRRCHNSKCRKWVVPITKPDGSMRCPKCGAPM